MSAPQLSSSTWPKRRTTLYLLGGNLKSEGEDDELEEEDSLSFEDEIYNELLPEVANSGFNFPDIREKLCTSVE